MDRNISLLMNSHRISITKFSKVAPINIWDPLEYMAPEILFTLPHPNPYPTCPLPVPCNSSGPQHNLRYVVSL